MWGGGGDIFLQCRPQTFAVSEVIMGEGDAGSNLIKREKKAFEA